MSLATPNPNSQPQPLTFPPLTYAKLAPASFLTAHLTHPKGPLRPSGRTPTQTRPPIVNTGSLTHANGSAVVRCGDTAVVCGVRAEVLKVGDVADYKARDVSIKDEEDEDEEVRRGEGGTEEERRKRRRRKREEDTAEMAHLNLLVPNLELATGCSPAHLPGGPPSPLAQTLTQRILTLLHTSHIIPIEALRIWSTPPATDSTTAPLSAETEDSEEEAAQKPKNDTTTTTAPYIAAFWTLYIDILFISYDGNPFDAAWFSLLAALNDTLLPHAWWDTDREMVLCSDDPAQAKRLELSDLPIPLSFGVFISSGEEEVRVGEEGNKKDSKDKWWVLLDTDAFEEALCKEHGTLVVGGSGRIIGIEKSGGGMVGVGEIRGLCEVAGRRRGEWMGLLGLGGR